jgi:hypothetical protein
MIINNSIATTTTTVYEFALRLVAAWELQRRGEEIYARAYDAANRAKKRAHVEAALDQMDAGEDLMERGYNMTVALSTLVVAAGVMDAVLAIVEPLYCL